MTSAATDTASLRFDIGSMVAPGDRLASLRHGTIQPGIGTYARGGHIFSALVGSVTLSNNNEVQVINNNKASPAVLQVGQLVLCKVTRIANNHATVIITASSASQQGGRTAAAMLSSLSSNKSSNPVEAMIRREDIRAKVGDELGVESCFQPNDWVLGRIVSLGDARRYYISTAETELGVVRALSATTQKVMVPTSWKVVQCTDTGRTEPRKVAKPNMEMLQEVLGN